MSEPFDEMDTERFRKAMADMAAAIGTFTEQVQRWAQATVKALEPLTRLVDFWQRRYIRQRHFQTVRVIDRKGRPHWRRKF